MIYDLTEDEINRIFWAHRELGDSGPDKGTNQTILELLDRPDHLVYQTECRVEKNGIYLIFKAAYESGYAKHFIPESFIEEHNRSNAC